MLWAFVSVVIASYGGTVNAYDQSLFYKPGDYLLGGLFKLHNAQGNRSKKPEALECHKFPFIPASYKRIQVMRFTIEEINNSTTLLPGVDLGYQIFDYCSDIGSLVSALDFSACGKSVYVGTQRVCQPNVISIAGPFGSTETITVSQLSLSNLLPMVTHGASSVQLSNKEKFPSFFRTIPSDKFQVRAIVQILREFRWNWVAFIGGDNDYSLDALGVFESEAEAANICLAYRGLISLSDDKANARMLDVINQHHVEVIVLFAHVEHVSRLLKIAVEKNMKKVWIGSETWSLRTKLIDKNDIKGLGTVLGVTVHQMGELRGLREFIYRTVSSTQVSFADSGPTCEQRCEECQNVTADYIYAQDSTFSYTIYSAIYAVAHALHSTLCSPSPCLNLTAEPRMLIKALKEVKFEINNHTIEFDENGDPPAYYDIVYWNWTSNEADNVGSFQSVPEPTFTLNRNQIHWHTGKNAPEFRCSPECQTGYKRVETSFHTCCFVCQICQAGTYINHTADPKECKKCEDYEWSGNGSTSCNKRTIVFLEHHAPSSILLMFAASVTILLCGCTLVLFARHYDSPVVKSAGGKMSLLVLVFLALSSVSVFLFSGRPSSATCSLRITTFLVFYTATLSCLAVRSFQIISIFKLATKLPLAYDFWVKHGGQWLIVSFCTTIQVLLSLFWMLIEGPQLQEKQTETQTVLICTWGNPDLLFAMFILVGVVSIATFAFAYMGTDLPKNYNEGKAVTFCLLIFYISWALFLTLYFVLEENDLYIVLANAFCILLSIFGVLFGYFGPKCYIIVFQPQRNTAAYFQAAIQNYTLQVR